MNTRRSFLQIFLAGISLALLLGFLLFWNIDQYQSEKIELTQKLSTQMSLACSEYRDSVVNIIVRRVTLSSKDSEYKFPISKHLDNRGNTIIDRDSSADSLFNQKQTLNRAPNNLTKNWTLEKHTSNYLNGVTSDIVVWKSDGDTTLNDVSSDIVVLKSKKDTTLNVCLLYTSPSPRD